MPVIINGFKDLQNSNGFKDLNVISDLKISVVYAFECMFFQVVPDNILLVMDSSFCYSFSSTDWID